MTEIAKQQEFLNCNLCQVKHLTSVCCVSQGSWNERQFKILKKKNHLHELCAILQCFIAVRRLLMESSHF